jgi:hypothetical protein
MQPRDAEHDDPLGLNCAWYADILMTLTAPGSAGAAAAQEGAEPEVHD